MLRQSHATSAGGRTSRSWTSERSRVDSCPSRKYLFCLDIPIESTSPKNRVSGVVLGAQHLQRNLEDRRIVIVLAKDVKHVILYVEWLQSRPRCASRCAVPFDVLELA